MFLLDFEEGRLIPDEELKAVIAAKRVARSGRVAFSSRLLSMMRSR
jgi:hypothetical protein